MSTTTKTDFTSESSLGSSGIGFDDMINHFGVVTVMNARVFHKPLAELIQLGMGETGVITTLQDVSELKAHDILKALLSVPKSEYSVIETLKIANINMEGPTKTVTGGQYANPLIKFGKTATIEMQDALGRADVLEALGAAVVETYATEKGVKTGATKVVHFANEFVGPTTIVGDSFFINQITGEQVPVQVVLYQVLPDAIFNLTQDSEGDATVFDLNGALLATTITIGTNNQESGNIKKGVFYSILPAAKASDYEVQVFKVKYLPVNENEIDDLTAKALEAEQYSHTTIVDKQGVGKYTIPTLLGYQVFTDATGLAPQEETAVELRQNTTYYLKPNADPAA